jgi:urease accessory protein
LLVSLFNHYQDQPYQYKEFPMPVTASPITRLSRFLSRFRPQFTASRLALASAGLAFAGAAQAHPGHADGAFAGLAHPFMGLDHLLAMVAVGIWAAQQGGRAKWLVPSCFVTVMALGGALGMAGMSLPMMESGIATSVLLLGLLIAFSVRLPAAAGAALVGLFAVFHGYAHGAEMPALASPWQYGVGFVIATALLHVLGLGVGAGMKNHGWSVRLAGAAVAACGAWMMAGI